MLDKKFKSFNELPKLLNFDYVKGILIDIDDTLYDYKTIHKKTIQLVYDHLNNSEKNFSLEINLLNHIHFIEKNY